LNELQKNKSVILVGGGASVKEGISKGLWEKIKSKTIWSCNYAFMTMPYLPKRQLWVDRSFFKNNLPALNELANKNVEMVCKANSLATPLPKVIGYNGIRTRADYFGKLGIEKNKIFCGMQGFVGTFALHIAICEGYNEIFLLGYDYGIPPGENQGTFTHFYQNKLNVKSTGMGRPEVYQDDKKNIKKDIEDYLMFLQEKDIKIWNVSMKSNIDCFEKITYERFFKQCQNG